MIGCDALVVGGGPAGSTCARDLARAGASVIVLDRAQFPRDKPCAGWITPAAVTALDLDHVEYARGRTLQPVTGFRTGVIGGSNAVTTDFGRVVSHAIRRCEFDHFLLQRSGAAVRAGTVVRQLRRERGRWLVDDRFEAPALIGAGGHFCPVARELNPGADAGPVVVAQEVELPMTPAQARACPVRGEVPELYFCADRRGYGWCVRKGEHLNVGFGRIGQDGFQRRRDEFLAFARGAGRLPSDLALEWRGHAYRIHAGRPRRWLADGAVLVGDAAGLAHPVSGEGILRAIESGRLAARTLVRAGGRYEEAALEDYRRAVLARYGAPARAPRGPGAPSRITTAVVRALLHQRWFARRVLLERWFLHVGLAPLPA